MTAAAAKADFSDRCCCGRVGDTYALLLCPVDAPIPFVLSAKGARAARRMKQWDAIFETLDRRIRRRR
jgi:hypothetical protein